jgi:hypothetical protein
MGPSREASPRMQFETYDDGVCIPAQRLAMIDDSHYSMTHTVNLCNLTIDTHTYLLSQFQLQVVV